MPRPNPTDASTVRILIVTQYFWPESFRINTLAESLATAGAEITVLTAQPNYPEGAIFPGYRAAAFGRDRYADRIDVLRVPIFPRGRGGALRLFANYLSFIFTASLCGPLVLRGRPFDVIFVYGASPILQAIPAMVLKRIKGAKLVTWVQDLWPESLQHTGFVRNRSVLKAVGCAVNAIYRDCDLLLGQSQAFVHSLGKRAGRTPVEYYPNPGEADFSQGKLQEPPAIILPPGFNVVFTGNLGTVQALETVLDAFTLLRDDGQARLVLVGSGSRSSWLAKEVRTRGLKNVLLPGRVHPRAIPSILAQASATLVSLAKGEILSQTIPTKIQAYFACGRPILASLDGEGANLVTTAGAGLASPAEDADELARNVRRLMAMEAHERVRMGEAGRIFFEQHFLPDVLAERLLNRLRLLIA